MIDPGKSGFRKITIGDVRALIKQMERFDRMSKAQQETWAEHFEARCGPGTKVTVIGGIPHIERFSIYVSNVLPKKP